MFTKAIEISASSAGRWNVAHYLRAIVSRLGTFARLAALAALLSLPILSHAVLRVSVEPPSPRQDEPFQIRVVGEPGVECPFGLSTQPESYTTQVITIDAIIPGLNATGVCNGVVFFPGRQDGLADRPVGLYTVNVLAQRTRQTVTLTFTVQPAIQSVPIGRNSMVVLVVLILLAGLVSHLRRRPQVLVILLLLGAVGLSTDTQAQAKLEKQHERQLIFLLDPSPGKQTARILVAQARDLSRGGQVRADFGNAKQLRQLVDDEKLSSRGEYLARVAPYSAESLLAQYVVAEYDNKDSRDNAKKKLKNEKKALAVFDDFELQPSATPFMRDCPNFCV
jgi:hypothetical protein